MQTRFKAVCGGIVAALVAFVPLFILLDRIFITYWEWQHEWRPMKLTLWADGRAMLITPFFSAVVFYRTVRYLQRRLSADQRIERRSLLIGVASTMVFMYLAIVSYVWVIVSRFSDRLQASPN